MARRVGSFDKSRDYDAAVARMEEIIRAGNSGREAERIVCSETNIPVSTLRRHYANRPKKANGPKKEPVFKLRLDLSNAVGVGTLTPEEAEEATRRAQEARRKRETDGTISERERRRLDMLRQLGLVSGLPPPRKKPKNK